VAAGPAVAAAGHRRDPGRPAQDDPPRRLGRAGAVRPGRQPGAGPSSKLAAAHWADRKAWIDRLPETTDDACYRAMDWVHQGRAAVEKEIYCKIANLLNLEAGKSKDHRDDLPQIVIGIAVTRDASRCGSRAGRGTRTTRR
jgi:hypothetical protein